MDHPLLGLIDARIAEGSDYLKLIYDDGGTVGVSFARLPEAPALAAANKRIGNILKKAEADEAVQAQVDGALLQEPAEQSLYAAMQQTVPQADAQFDAGDYTASLQTLARLREPVDAFFDGVMVNAEDAALRRNRQGLLKTLHLAMNRVADLSRLAQ